MPLLSLKGSFIKTISQYIRVKKRLQLLLEEEKKMAPKGQEAGPSSSHASTVKQESSGKKKTLADNLAEPAYTGSNLSASTFFSNYDKMSTDELYKIVKIRKNQYWNLANYLHTEVCKKLDETVS
jgi:hypothetical protein